MGWLALWQACGHCFEGVLLTKRGDAVRGLQVLRDALDELRETEFVLYYTTFLGALAEALARAGDATQGLAVIDEALTRSGDSKELRFFADGAAKKWPLRGSLKLTVETL